MAMLPMKMESRGPQKVVLRGSLLIQPFHRLSEISDPACKDTVATNNHGGPPRQRHTDLGCRAETKLLRPEAYSPDTARCHHALSEGARVVLTRCRFSQRACRIRRRGRGPSAAGQRAEGM